MKILKWALAAVTLSLVAACGGDGENAGASPFNPGGCSAASSASGVPCTTASASSVDVLATAVQVGSGGDTVTISAVVKDANNVALAGAPVSFSANNGNLTGVSAITNTSGLATAVFAAGADRSNRQSTVTVKSGSASGQIVLDVVGTVLSYTGVTTVPLNGVATLPVKVVDSRGTPISGFGVSVTSSLGNGLSASSLVTDSLGNAAVTYTATTAGADTLAFTAPGSSVSPVIQISAADFTFVTPAASTQIPVNTTRTVTVRYLSGNVPQAGKTINFAATAGVVSPAVGGDRCRRTSERLDFLGQTASPAVIQAAVSGVAVQATLPVAFVALTPAKLVLQVSPTAIGPNPAGSTSQQSQLRRDRHRSQRQSRRQGDGHVQPHGRSERRQPVAGLDRDRRQRPGHGPVHRGRLDHGQQRRCRCARRFWALLRCSAMRSLTVNQSALFIALGTGNTIENLDTQTYKKDWVVYVTDSNGVAVPNINLTIKILPTEYRKGRLVFVSGVWVYDPTNYFQCENEDLNYNGILDSRVRGLQRGHEAATRERDLAHHDSDDDRLRLRESRAPESTAGRRSRFSTPRATFRG